MSNAGLRRLLVIDGDLGLCRRLSEGLRSRGFLTICHDDSEAALSSLSTCGYDAVLAELHPETGAGLRLCQRIAQVEPTLPVIVAAANCGPESAVAAIRAGAVDFLAKPFQLDAVALALERAVQHRTLKQEVRRLRVELSASDEASEEIIGRSPEVIKLRALIRRISQTDASVVILGETGSGKELVARTVHRLSPRRHGPLVAVNCGAMPEALLESELFGHVKGAFTGANVSREGLMQHAKGGVLFLDEVAEMPLSLQVKLLRALQERHIRPVGSDQEVPIDFRLLSATNVDLEEAVREGRFREDLLYRIQVIRLQVPPLRHRGNDVLLLAQRFLTEFSQQNGKPVQRMSSAFAERILSYDWPGNIRQLRNCMERAVTMADHEELVVEDLARKIREFKDSSHLVTADHLERFAPLSQVERHYIFRVLEAVGGNKARAARILGVNRKTLYRKLQGYLAQTRRLPRQAPESGRSPKAKAPDPDR